MNEESDNLPQMLQPGSPAKHSGDQGLSVNDDLNHRDGHMLKGIGAESYQHQRGKRKRPRALPRQSQQIQSNLSSSDPSPIQHPGDNKQDQDDRSLRFSDVWKKDS